MTKLDSNSILRTRVDMTPDYRIWQTSAIPLSHEVLVIEAGCVQFALIKQQKHFPTCMDHAAVAESGRACFGTCGEALAG